MSANSQVAVFEELFYYGIMRRPDYSDVQVVAILIMVASIVVFVYGMGSNRGGVVVSSSFLSVVGFALLLWAIGKERRAKMMVGVQGHSRASAIKAEDFVGLSEEAKKYIVGQDDALKKIEKVLVVNAKLAQMGNQKRKRVLASFLLVGTTGVGKTETTKVIAYLLSGKGYGYTRLDMNQYSVRWSVTTMLGAGKGYIGSDTPGVLPHAFMSNPRQVLLFDEVEKAEGQLFVPFLQLLDEGYVQDMTTGRHLYADHAVVFFTSNLYSKEIGRLACELSEVDFDIRVRALLQEHFPPEFLGRLDAIVPYRPLTEEDLFVLTVNELMRFGKSQEEAERLALECLEKYIALAEEYGVRYYLKKVAEAALSGI